MTMNSSTAPTDLTPKHVRAARALLAWSQQELAKAAGVATSTVADFERGQRTPVANNAQAIRSALEGAGIRFLPTGAIVGPAVPTITPSDRPGAPVRWVSAEDLSEWANRTDGAVSLPTLLAHLIQAGADAILVPSRFEPCVLTQLCALRYGAIPVVARVGGLADTVIDANEAAMAAGVATGIQFNPVNGPMLDHALRRTAALWRDQKAWREMQKNAMRADVSWRASARRYAELFREVVGG